MSEYAANEGWSEPSANDVLDALEIVETMARVAVGRPDDALIVAPSDSDN